MASGEGGNGAQGGTFGPVVLVLVALVVAAGVLMPSKSTPTRSAAFEPMSAPAAPVRLVVPALKLRAAVLPIEVSPSAVLDPPADPTQVGWWQRSARPGAQRGQTVLTGHTVHTGGGVMDRLGSLKPGQVVRVGTRRGTMVYRTTRVLTLTKAQLAERSRDLFAQGRDINRLVLITCTGWTGSGYTSNTIVFARPLGVRVPGADA
ncbi:MAG: Sortase family protein [Marmoricola sp.]|nr:Sortase family protein [Marmoricola sp.]